MCSAKTIRLLERGIVLVVLTSFPFFASPATTDCPKIGAIRWDAWYGAKDEVGLTSEQILGVKKWQYRLPFCARIVSDSEVKIECSTQEAVDKEIEYADAAGIDYWAFVAYPPESPASESLNRYLVSSKKGLVKFAMLSQAWRWSGPAKVGPVLDRFVALMKEPTYQRVMNNRPLFFLGFIRDDHLKAQWGGEEGFDRAVKDFRKRAIESGAGDPYIVVMDFDPRRARALRMRFGFDAISSYAVLRNAKRGSYEELVASARAFWETAKALGEQVVPTVMAGWDRRPRVEISRPWDRGKESADAIERYYELPLPGQLADHVESAISWVRKNRRATRVDAIIIYAWNEYDEGGWIAPTLGEGNARIKAVGDRIQTICPVWK